MGFEWLFPDSDLQRVKLQKAWAMVAVSLDSLRTPANGQILALEGPLSKAALDRAFKTAAEKSRGRSIVREVRQKRSAISGDFWASLISFPITDTPSFFPETVLKEHLYGFLLLLEVEVEGKWFLGVFKKACSSINDWLDRRAKHLPRTKLTNAFAEGAAINRLNLRRMTVSQHELHGASYEAPELDTAASEKGKPKKADIQFPADSIFGVSERALYQQRDWLCCADLGDEWADYLCIRGNALLFIHCKGGGETTGASSFQEVVGQGLKNLGRTRSTPKEFEAKLAATKKKRFWAGTKIERLRDAGREWADFQTAVATVLADPNAGREVHLVVTMLSKDGFEAAAAAAPPTPHFIQLVWLLVSFINSCREMGAKPVIVCKP